MMEEEWLRCTTPSRLTWILDHLGIDGARQTAAARLESLLCLGSTGTDHFHRWRDEAARFLEHGDQTPISLELLRGLTTIHESYDLLHRMAESPDRVRFAAQIDSFRAFDKNAMTDGIHDYMYGHPDFEAWESYVRLACPIIRDIFGNPFRPVAFSPEWRTTTAVAIAQGMYDSRDFGPMPLLADALQDAGCEEPEIIDHCRGPGPHVRGCWVVDGVLGKV